jgi:hypothetical protein
MITSSRFSFSKGEGALSYAEILRKRSMMQTPTQVGSSTPTIRAPAKVSALLSKLDISGSPVQKPGAIRLASVHPGSLSPISQATPPPSATKIQALPLFRSISADKEKASVEPVHKLRLETTPTPEFSPFSPPSRSPLSASSPESDTSASQSLSRPDSASPGIDSNWRIRNTPTPPHHLSPFDFSGFSPSGSLNPSSFDRFRFIQRSSLSKTRGEDGAGSPFARPSSASPDHGLSVTPRPHCISPSFDSISARKERTQKEFQSYKSKFPWIEKGELIEKPIPFQLIEVTGKFLETRLGKQALIAAEIYLKEEESSLTPIEYLTGTKFVEGSCLGQSFAFMVAFMQLENGAKGSLKDLIKTDHIRFFHQLELLNGNEHIASFLPSKVRIVDILCNTKIEAIKLRELRKLSGLTRDAKYKIAYLETDAEAQMRAIFSNPRITAFEIGLINNEPGDGHSIVALFGKDVFLYDSITGLIKETSREGFIHDVFNYFKLQLKEANPLCTIYIESFTQAKKEEGKASKS